jgi:putative phosphoribosyl transferase
MAPSLLHRMAFMPPHATTANGTGDTAVVLTVGNARLSGDLIVPSRPIGVVLLVDVSGSTGRSPTNLFVAKLLERSALASLLLNLLAASEAAADARTGWLRTEIPLLANRIIAARRWLAAAPETEDLPVGVFATGHAAAAALAAAAEEPGFAAIVCCPGQTRLAGARLGGVRAPTLIVAGMEGPELLAARSALAELRGEKELAVVPGVTRRFQEPGALESVGALAERWFSRHLAAQWLAAQTK